jgi:hypothetical protein
MAFSVLPTIMGRWGLPAKTTGSLSYRRLKYKTGARMKEPKLVISIPKHFTDGIVIEKGDRYILMVGDGDDVGKARLMKSSNGEGSKVQVFAGSVSLRFGFVPMLGHDAAEKEDIDVRQVPGGFEIDLPSWFSAKV